MPAATSVITSTARLLRSGAIRQPPAWWSVVQAHPPSPPTFARTHRHDDNSSDSATRTYTPSQRRRKNLRPLKPRLPTIEFGVEDKVRLRFYTDHPWEAARSHTVVEADVLESNEPSGKAWISLEERSSNPTAEDAIAFAVNLVEAHRVNVDDAYRIATTAFRRLRARHEIATRMAATEAESYGTVFDLRAVNSGYALENKALESWDTAPPTEDSGASASRSVSTVGGMESVRGRETVEGAHPGQRRAAQPFTAGQDYLADDLSRLDSLSTIKPTSGGATGAGVNLAQQALDDAQRDVQREVETLSQGSPAEAAAVIKRVSQR